MFRFAVVASLLTTASAFLGNIDPNSKELRRLLKDATLTEGRGLANNNYAYQLNGEMANLHIKYTGCSNLYSMGQNGQGGNNNNKNGQDFLTRSAVASFEILEGCNGDLVGKYTTPMVTFADTYTENMMTEQQWRCEQYIELYCYGCKDVADDDGACYTNCTNGKFDASGYDVSVCSAYIQQGNDKAEEFNVQRYLECGKMQNNNNNNNNNGNNGADYYTDAYTAYAAFDGKFRVGPYCNDADGYSILLGVFYDQYCSVRASSDIFEGIYGEELPYSDSSIVPKNSCVACADPQKQYEQAQNQNGNNNNQVMAREVCTYSYAASVKCEDTGSDYLTLYGATTSGCEFVSQYIPAVNSAYSTEGSKSGKAGNAFAWIFAFTTLMFAGYAYFLYSKLRRGASAMASRDGTGALA